MNTLSDSESVSTIKKLIQSRQLFNESVSHSEGIFIRLVKTRYEHMGRN